LSLIDKVLERQKKRALPENIANYKERTSGFFKMMSSIYVSNSVWRSSIAPAEAKRIWAISLAQVTDKQLAIGIEALEEAFPKFPPNSMQFKKLCLAGSQKDEYQLQKFSDMKPLN